ncbi:voltage-dependent calcium channel subunit alpha-2/delta-2-like [Amphiura filiformis]|uniref:voltage-dependent calcium channel subunit alpha-2/delta-2-like n=1 Tax=Amphiura filiformis TaxID=82378 RepID=UPI003B2243BC
MHETTWHETYKVEMELLMWLALMCFGPVVSSASGDLTSFLDEVETQLNSLHDVALGFYQQRCTLDCTQAFNSNPYSCSTNLVTGNGSSCSTDYGAAFYVSEPGCMQCHKRNINSYFTTVQTPSSKATCTDRLNSDVCWTKDLEDSFRSSSIPGRKWQLIATENGFTRLHPGILQEQCYSYDPRLRSWYAAASTGPKDVVILVDSSSSMDFVPPDSQTGESRMDLAKQAVNHVLGTLTFVDYIAVIKFSTEADEVPVDGVYTLIEATKHNIQALTKEVNQIEPSGHTNFEQAFRLAFDMFDRSAKVDRTSGCNKVILFLTDGSPTRGEEDPAKLSQIITSLNRGSNGQKKASILSYSIGELTEGETRQEILHNIACDNNGLTSDVETEEVIGLQEQLSQYHDYFSTLHTGPSHTVWTEPYLDSFGAEQVMTAARALYNNDAVNASNRFIGVISVDISYQYIRQLESNYDKLLEALRQKQTTCPQIQVAKDCDLEVLRQKVYDDGTVAYVPNINKLCNSGSICSLPGNQVCPDTSFQYEQCQQYKTTSQNYKKEACCGEFIECTSSANSLHWLHLHRLVFLHSVLLFLVFR